MTKKSQQFIHPCYGTVILKDWLMDPRTGNKVLAIRGIIEAQQNHELVGFDASNREANWCLRIYDEAQKNVFVILGCQIRGIMAHGKTGLAGSETAVLE